MSNNIQVAPVLLIIFNRPKFSQVIIEKLRNTGIRKLYVYSDHWRDEIEGEKEKVIENREQIRQIVDWDCEVVSNFSDINLGSGEGVFSAISWIFKYEEKAIILEEDCIPAMSFFPYCTELLEKFKNDYRVWEISGLNHFNGKRNLNNTDSYFFSKYASIWGFATWRDRWNKADFMMKEWPMFKRQNYIFDHVNRLDGKISFIKYSEYYNRIEKEKPKTWDAQWGFTIWANRGIGIVPAKNLISNIGIQGVHSNKAIPYMHLLSIDENFKIENHPSFYQTNYIYDDEYLKYFRAKSIRNKIKRVLLKIILNL